MQVYLMPSTDFIPIDYPDLKHCLIVSYSLEQYPYGLTNWDEYLDLLKQKIGKLIVREFNSIGKNQTLKLIDRYINLEDFDREIIQSDRLAEKIIDRLSLSNNRSSIFDNLVFPLLPISDRDEIQLAEAITRTTTLTYWLDIMFERAIPF